MTIRVFNGVNEQWGEVIYQYLDNGKLELVRNNSVVFSATPERFFNYNQIVKLIASYKCTIPDGKTGKDSFKEMDIKLPKEISRDDALRIINGSSKPELDYKKETEMANMDFDKAIDIIAYLLNWLNAEHIYVVEDEVMDCIKEVYGVNLWYYVEKDKDRKWKPIED